MEMKNPPIQINAWAKAFQIVSTLSYVQQIDVLVRVLNGLKGMVPAYTEPAGCEAVQVPQLPDGGPEVLHPEFGDPETLFNSREWLTNAVKTAGATVDGGGCGMGQCDIDILLEGCKFNISMRPLGIK